MLRLVRNGKNLFKASGAWVGDRGRGRKRGRGREGEREGMN